MQIIKYICDDCLTSKNEKEIEEILVDDNRYHICEPCVHRRLSASLKYFEPMIKCPTCHGINRARGERLSLDNNDFSSVPCADPIHASLEIRMRKMQSASSMCVK